MIKNINDPNYFGYANDPHFIKNNDNRIPQWVQQYKERGFDNSELWSLDVTIAKFCLPRLIEFKKHTHDETDKLDKIIEAFKIICSEAYYHHNTSDFDKVNEGLKIFFEIYRGLWL